jgi:hypothetical protein
MAEEIAMTVMTAETKTSFALAGSTCSISSAEPLAPRTWKSVYSSSDLLPDGSSLCVFELGSLRRILPVFSFSTRQISVSEREYGAEQTRTALLTKGFVRSMSRAGTPTDNGYAERFVGQFKLSVAECRSYPTLGDFLRAAEAWVNFYNQDWPHEGLDQQSPDHYARDHGLPTAPSLSLL